MLRHWQVLDARCPGCWAVVPRELARRLNVPSNGPNTTRTLRPNCMSSGNAGISPPTASHYRYHNAHQRHARRAHIQCMTEDKIVPFWLQRKGMPALHRPRNALVHGRIYAGWIQRMPGAHGQACPAPGLRCQVPLRRRGAGAPHGRTNPLQASSAPSAAIPGLAPASRAADSQTHKTEG